MKMNGEVQVLYRAPAAALLAALAMAGFAACDESSGGSKSSAPDTARVYVVNDGSDTISGFEVNYGDGTVEALSGAPWATDIGPWNVVATPAGDRLFVTGNAADTVQSFGIDTDSGDLTEEDSESTDAGPRAIAVDPDGGYVYAGGQTSTLEMFSVNTNNGALTNEGFAPNPNGMPNAGVIDSAGETLYVVSPNIDNVDIYTIQSDGSLTQDFSPYPVGDFAWSLAITADDAHLYVANLNASSVDVAEVQSDGDLNFVETMSTGTNPTGVAVTPSGDFVYVSNLDGVTGFSRDSATGELTELGSVDTGTSPEALAIDATGSFLAVVDSGDNTLRVFAIDPDTGELAESDDSPISTGDEPRSIAIVNVN